jgi:hypothetical protein
MVPEGAQSLEIDVAAFLPGYEAEVADAGVER